MYFPSPVPSVFLIQDALSPCWPAFHWAPSAPTPLHTMAPRGTKRSHSQLDELDEKALYEVVLQHAKAKGKSWLRYGETSSVQSAKLDREAVAKHVDCVKALKNIRGNLSFTEKQMTTCMGKVFDALHVAWKLEASMRRSWTQAMQL